jgi:hypothetical protein
VFDLFRGGNSGNEASLEALLGYLRDRHPEAVIDAMSGWFRQIPGKFGIPATPLTWHEYRDQARGPAGAVARVVGKALDPLRLFRWVRRHDVVIVPSMGVLEDSTPVGAYWFPLPCSCSCPPGGPARSRWRELCDAHGVLLILDETITGFRWHVHGAQFVYGIEPDVSVFGKGWPADALSASCTPTPG